MRCPFCSHDETQVVETRDSDEGDVVRRRRRCHSCDKRFTTYERAEIAMPSVVKKDGTRAEFDRAKVLASMTLALRKRPVSVEQIDAAMERIQDKLLNSGAKEVPSARLGELVMRELKRIDKVAYVRFASVYRSFEDVDEFRQLIRDIRIGPGGRRPAPPGFAATALAGSPPSSSIRPSRGGGIDTAPRDRRALGRFLQWTLRSTPQGSPMQPPIPSRGVTLVETCMVLAVTGVLACTAIPGLQRLLEGRRLDGAALQLATDIRYVRSEAIARNQAIRLAFQSDGSGSCYIAHTGPSGQCRCVGEAPATCAGGATALRSVHFPTGSGTSVRSNVSSIVFDPLHGTSTPTGTLRIVAPSGREVHQVINLMGRLRACSPGAAVPGYSAC